MANVLLLRAPTSQDGPDKYENAFRKLGYRPVSVPVLETVLKNLAQLKAIIIEGHSAQGISGVIVTSGRACEAWKAVVEDLVSDVGTPGLDTPADWSCIPFYVVGEATAAALADIRASLGDSSFSPIDIRGGSESGTSERLAQFILRDLPATSGSRKLLYLTGDKNRDTLPNILKAGGLELQPLQVYETQGSSTFAQDLKIAIDEIPLGSSRWWIVYFAPSAADFVAPILRDHFDLPSLDALPVATSAKDIPRIAAIGPTTSAFLRDKLRIPIDVTPPKPTADSLASAIAAWEREHIARPS